MQSGDIEKMESGDFSPAPVHVHVTETTPVHVHTKTIPNRTTQIWTNNVQVEIGRRPKMQKPWVPPGRLPCRKDLGSRTDQRSRAHHKSGGSHQCDEEDIAAVSKNINALLREQDSIPRLKKSDSRDLRRETDMLLRALVEAEIDGLGVSNQLTALKETVESHFKNKQLASLHAASLKQQQKLVLEKIDAFGCTNRNLRDLLREWADYERESLRSSEERDALKKRVADSEAQNIQLLLKVNNMEKETSKLFEHLELEKDKAKTSEELSRILQSTHSRLESELNRRESEKANLIEDLQRMQHSREQQQRELQTMQEELQTLRQCREKEKEEQGRQDQEALAFLIQKAEQAEESAKQFELKLQETETDLLKALSTSSDWLHRHSKEAAVKAQLEEEISALKTELTELSARLRSAGERSRTENEGLVDQIHRLSAEKVSTDVENKRLRDLLMSTEDMLKNLQSEARQMRSSIREHDDVLEEYKKKIQQIRAESGEYCLKLEITQKEMQDVKLRLEMEKDQLKQELEMMADKLRSTKQQLRDAEQEGEVYQRRIEEDRSSRTELRHRVEHQDTQLETIQEWNLLLQEENNVLKDRLHTAERKLKVEYEEISRALSSKEASFQHVQKQLEEKTIECNVLSRQLQQAVDDAQKQVENSMQRVFAKERISQKEALDLQLQLTKAKEGQAQLQRSKEEMELRYQNQMKNLKKILEQSDNKNRILQNYVDHLKASYVNVFTDSFPAR